MAVERFVVACGVGAPTRHAVEWMRYRALQSSVSVTLIQVVSPTEAQVAGRLEQAEQTLRSMECGLADRVPGLHVSTDVQVGELVDTLVRRTVPESILVVGMVNSGLLHRPTSWSTGARLAARARGPVTIIPAGCALDGHGVLVGIDGGENCLRIARFAAEQALAMGQPLHLLHAWIPPTPLMNAYPLDNEIVAECVEPHIVMLADVERRMKEDFPHVEITSSVVRGDPALCLLDTHDVPGLIVVGSRAKSALHRFLLGSVSRDLLLNATIPTLVVPPAVA